MPLNPAIKRVLCIYTCYLPVEKDGVLMQRHEDWFGNEQDILEIPATRLGEFLQTKDFILVGDDDD